MVLSFHFINNKEMKDQIKLKTSNNHISFIRIFIFNIEMKIRNKIRRSSISQNENNQSKS